MAGYGIRAYLIAQSLNQISKAYGENNSILDNCHVRIAFSSNDERTAKRISDALGTATELRAQRNYAGHRLSPWLSHVMVAEQETARPLLDARRSDATAARRRTGAGFRPGADPRQEASILRRRQFHRARHAGSRTWRWRLSGLPEPARPDDWGGQVRGPAMLASVSVDRRTRRRRMTMKAGLRQQRHPGLPEREVGRRHGAIMSPTSNWTMTMMPLPPRPNDLTPGAPGGPRAHAMNEGDHHREPRRRSLPAF